MSDSASSFSADSKSQIEEDKTRENDELNEETNKAPKMTDLDLTLKANPTIAKVLTEKLVKQVSASVTEINLQQMEGRIKDLVMRVMEVPLQKMTLQEEILSKYAQSQRRVVRQVHELEFLMQKYQRASLLGEKTEKRITATEESIAQQNAKYEQQLAFMRKKITEDVPDMLQASKDELELWKRWFMRIQKEFDNCITHQERDRRQIISQLKMALEKTHKNVDDLHSNQNAMSQDV